MADLPTFDEFYAATHRGRQPFPWQRRLADLVAAEGWPDEIGVPTGLGKTACLDIAVWALAAQADRPARDRTAPTRTWYVVNRRLLVDAAWDHGLALSKWLETPASLREDWDNAKARHVEVIESVATALEAIVAFPSVQGPLHVTRLRGSADLGARPPDPSQPALVFATVPMFASRWLFRGYGSSASMRPVDAALAGTDSLVLLDEAHLAPPLARLAAAEGPLEQCDVGNPTRLLRPERARPRLVALTATGEAEGDRFDLDEDDLAHPEVQKRLRADKPTRLRASTRKTLIADLASATVEILEASAEPTSCLVFANTPDTAREVFERIAAAREASGLAIDCHLLTGRMREREAQGVRKAILDQRSGAPSSRDHRLAREQHLVIVATQTLEVGADIDVDHLVTETAGVRSIVQRFGRLNRLGNALAASAVVVHPTDEDDRPVYGTEAGEVWRSLQTAAERGQGEIAMSPKHISDVLGEPHDQPPAVGELLPHHLWDWAKTSVPRIPLAQPELFYDAFDDRPQVTVLWRTYIPGKPVLTVDETTLDNEARPRRLVPPPQGDEAIDLPRRVLVRALEARQATTVARLRGDGVTVETVDVDALRPGDQVVLPARWGLYDKCGWAPDARDLVPDRSLLRAGLVLKPDVVRALFKAPPAGDPDPDVDDEPATDRPGWRQLLGALDVLAIEWRDDLDQDERDEQVTAALQELAEMLAALDPPEDLTDDESVEWRRWWPELVERLGRGKAALSYLDDNAPFVAIGLPRKRSAQSAVRSDAFDDLSFVKAKSPLLHEHLETVRDVAARIAEHVGIDDDLVAVLREAGGTHDVGKLEPRFQRWLSASGRDRNEPQEPETSEPLAKSATPPHRREQTRRQAGWPRGGRHELLSARLLADGLPNDAPHRDLLLHLVIAHHGHGRPSVAVAKDDEPTKVHAEVRGEPVVVSGDLSLPDWDQPSRFRRLCETYGYWGLALLEAIVRQADHAASAQAGIVPGEVETA